MARDLHQDEDLQLTRFDYHTLVRLAHYLIPQIPALIAVVVLLLVITGIEIISVKWIGEAVDLYIVPLKNAQALTAEEATAGLTMYALKIIALYLVQAVMTFVQMTLLVSAGQHVISALRMDIYQHVQKLPASYFDLTPTGKVVTRLTNDVNNIHEAFAGVIVYLIKDVFLMVGILIFMFKLSPKLAMVLLIPLPIIVITSLIFRILNRRVYRKVRESLSRLNSFMMESFSGIETIKTFVQEHKQAHRFKMINSENYTANMKSIFLTSLCMPLVGFFVALPTALLLWYGGYQILSGVLTLGSFLMMINFLRMFYEPIVDFSQKYILMQSAMASAERLFQLQDIPIADERTQAGTHAPLGERIKGRIEFRDVCFSYDKRKRVLDHVSFVIEPGQTLALVGDTGSGKTTITALLCRFYEIDSGEILIDGVNIATLPLFELRRHIAIVMQEPFIFSRTVLENIKLNSETIDDPQAIRAATLIGAGDFINDLPLNYQEPLRERGNNISAGQRQLLAFSRALAHDRSIIVLDEATASIDSATESVIQRATLTLLANRTAIVVAHRLSTIRHANQIIVMQLGKIIESGTHESLLASGGHYAQMVQRQFDPEVA